MKTKYDVYDEYGRLVEENVSLRRAQVTVKVNPGSTKTKAISILSDKNIKR